ncbi:MAG: nuclear transport factor 2 family protein [Rhizobiales bacterium]|nr:nuclear transport factor 2 family protein [Hyphomicrobiales bacterium]
MTETNDVTALVDRYIAMWNETDPARVLRGEGRDGIVAMVGQVHERFPGHRFTRTSPVDSHGDRARFGWALGPEDGPPVVAGVDFAAIDDGRLAAVTGFFDAVAQQPAA